MDDAKNNVRTEGGDYVGRDMNIHGDKVAGDKVGRDKITYEIHAAPPAPKPGSAPPLPGLVVGREDDLRALKTHLGIGGEGQILTIIRGWPGIGKTTVAAVLAHDPDVMAAFPDGVLWTSLGPAPSLFSALATWSRALGVDDLRAQTLEEASAALAAMLRGKRMFLVVDDVWQAEHARPFTVGGRGCATLITTRSSQVARALAPTDDDIYHLTVLTEEKGLELLKKLAPKVVAAHCDECRALVKALDGLPLALQVAGRLLAVEAGYGFGVDDLLTELRAGTALLAAQAPADRADLVNESTPSVAALLQHSTDRLDQATRAAFACLAAFPAKPASFDLAAMQVVCQVDDAKPIARALVDRGLLEAVPETGRFQVHALLVMHAGALVAQDAEAYRRHAEYYLKVLRAADDLYMQGGEALLRGVALFDQEWDNVQAGQAWTAAHAAQDRTAARMCSVYPAVGAYYLELRWHPHEWIDWLEAALAAARRLRDRQGEGIHTGSLGNAHHSLGQVGQAIEYYEQALAIAREIGDRRSEANRLGDLGVAYANLGQAERALEHLQQALVIEREIGAASTPDSPEWKASRRSEGTILGNLGNAYADLGYGEQALEHYEQALVIRRKIGDRRGEGADLGNLGNVYYNLGQVERAIEHYQQALDIVREIGDQGSEGLWLGNLGVAYRDLGQADRARECLERALAISEEIQSPDAEWIRRALAGLG